MLIGGAPKKCSSRTALRALLCLAAAYYVPSAAAADDQTSDACLPAWHDDQFVKNLCAAEFEQRMADSSLFVFFYESPFSACKSCYQHFREYVQLKSWLITARTLMG